jgi:hypothetical protein
VKFDNLNMSETSPTAKFYIASIMAVRRDGSNIELKHSPAFIPAFASIKHAAGVAQSLALESYPTIEGWTHHEAYLLPITNDLIAQFGLLQRLHEFEAFERDPNEVGTLFKFPDPTLPSVPSDELTH